MLRSIIGLSCGEIAYSFIILENVGVSNAGQALHFTVVSSMKKCPDYAGQTEKKSHSFGMVRKLKYDSLDRRSNESYCLIIKKEVNDVSYKKNQSQASHASRSVRRLF